ncbi:hypothetical protein [Burkholderia ubonensis]|uniref:hypothetical protein n=1 Tax=Burkholderia ubonensis TaxID=101571 RepID=UPI0012F73E91|nr:hypothetical protein [Burkholderia ubonensis]
MRASSGCAVCRPFDDIGRKLHRLELPVTVGPNLKNMPPPDSSWAAARNMNDRRTCQKEQVPQQSFFMHSFPPRDASRFPPSGASMRRFKIHAIVSACVVTNATVGHSTAAPMNASRIRTLDETGGLP